MAQKTDIQLSTQADEVRDETTANANSALRVGTLFEDIVDSKMNNSLLIDEDNMASDSATRVPSQQSVKAYVDAQAGETASAVTFTPAGTIAATDVQAALEELDTEKAPLASPALTGIPTAPTASVGTSTTQIATTAFVQAATAFSFVSVTGAVTLDNTAFGNMHLCSGTSTNYTIALPTAVGNTNKSIGFKGVDGLTRTVTIDGNSGETIDGEDSREFTGGGLFVVLSDGANWHIVAEVGSWVPYTPVWTGFSADPTVISSKYFRQGKLCTVKVRTSANGTSNATTTTVTVPFNAASLQINLLESHANNGTVSTTPGAINTRASSNIIDLYTNLQSAAWTASGGKRASFTLLYELE